MGFTNQLNRQTVEKYLDLLEKVFVVFVERQKANHFKWQGQVRPAARREFTAAHPGAKVVAITPENFTDFLK